MRLAGQTFSWEYPDADFEAINMPAGYGKWCSKEDGIQGLRTVTTPDPIAGLAVDEISKRAGQITPSVRSILIG